MLRVGFATLRAHEIVDIDRCPILVPGLSGAIDAAWAIAETLKDVRKPLDIQITATDAGMDVDVRGSGAINTKRTSMLAAVAEKHRLPRLTRHGIEMQPPRIFDRDRRANNARGITDDEGHLLRGTKRGGDEQIALVLAIIVVGDDDDLAACKSGDDGVDTLLGGVHFFPVSNHHEFPIAPH